MVQLQPEGAGPTQENSVQSLEWFACLNFADFLEVEKAIKFLV